MPNWEKILLAYRYPLLIIIFGLILIGFGALYYKSGMVPQTKVEVLDATTESQAGGEMTVEINGAVTAPGVYKLAGNSRVEDLLVSAGGFSGNADRVWTDKYLNRAAKMTDGQKIYIPRVGEQSAVMSAKDSGGDQTTSSVISPDSTGPININSASLTELDSLPGIGQVYGQSIIDHRPYSNVSELLSKGVLKQSVYNKIKERLTVY